MAVFKIAEINACRHFQNVFQIKTAFSLECTKTCVREHLNYNSTFLCGKWKVKIILKWIKELLDFFFVSINVSLSILLSCSNFLYTEYGLRLFSASTLLSLVSFYLILFHMFLSFLHIGITAFAFNILSPSIFLLVSDFRLSFSCSIPFLSPF